MSLFDRLFRGGSHRKKAEPKIQFGRYTDSYKTAEQQLAWEMALEQFERESYDDSYKNLFSYLSDEALNNVAYSSSSGVVNFEILQGSKKIIGRIDSKLVRIEAKVVKADELKVAFMRRLLDANYGLRYSRYAVDDDGDISIVSDSFRQDASPYKIFYAMREVALAADKQDDILIDEFDILHTVNSGHVRPLPDHEKNVKSTFVHQWINECLEIIDKGRLDAAVFPAAVTYRLLHLVYKLDYLISSEGFITETLERIHRKYFAQDQKSVSGKNLAIRKELELLLARDHDKLSREMYQVTSTFGITNPISHDKIREVIDNELHAADWYLSNSHPDVAVGICGYIIGYLLFNFAVPIPAREYFHLFYEITESEYFKSLGFQQGLVRDGVLQKSEIITRIKDIRKANKNTYGLLDPRVNHLNFESMGLFAKSYLQVIYTLDMTMTNIN